MEKLGRLQILRVASVCGAAVKSIERYQDGLTVRPAVEYAIRSAITQLRYHDPRPACAEGQSAVQK